MSCAVACWLCWSEALPRVHLDGLDKSSVTVYSLNIGKNWQKLFYEHSLPNTKNLFEQQYLKNRFSDLAQICESRLVCISLYSGSV